MLFWKAMKEGYDDSLKRGFPDIIEGSMKDAGFEVQTIIDQIVYAPSYKRGVVPKLAASCIPMS